MIIKILAGFIPNKTLRGFFRNFLYSLQIKLKAKQIGNNLLCSKFSTVNKKTVIGNNVKFNGLHINILFKNIKALSWKFTKNCRLYFL